MNSKEFNQHRKDFFEEAMALSDAKSVEYTISSSDRLANFKYVASRVGTKPMQALLGYVLKHMDAICNDAKTGKQFSDETFRSRCLDICNYMVLATALHIDEQKEPHTNDTEDNTNQTGTEHGVVSGNGTHDTEPKKWKSLKASKT